jgi:hypothetical protein
MSSLPERGSPPANDTHSPWTHKPRGLQYDAQRRQLAPGMSRRPSARRTQRHAFAGRHSDVSESCLGARKFPFRRSAKIRNEVTRTKNSVRQSSRLRRFARSYPPSRYSSSGPATVCASYPCFCHEYQNKAIRSANYAKDDYSLHANWEVNALTREPPIVLRIAPAAALALALTYSQVSFG